jgi:Acyclic terpene utilisation family protein AtuA
VEAVSDPIIRIANASGYWGDDLTALRRQLEGGPLDVVTLDFLAEITMSILQKQKDRDPEAGFARDFVEQLDDVMQLALERGVVVISNAGGVAPRRCAEVIRERAQNRGLDPRVGIVAGDDVMAELDAWHEQGIDLSNMDDGRSFAEIRERVTSANCYFGANPVVRALERDAQFIVTGRVTDTGITLAPMMHRFGWAPTDYDQLASGIIAGHILECGAQSTGGNFTDWRDVPSFHEVGYPICEMSADGSFVITKHPETGGMVAKDSIAEQLVYEMGDPRSYITPDVVVDFSSIRFESDGPDRVRVWGVRGAAPTPLLKVSVSYEDGYKASGAVIICGPEAREKSEAFADIFWKRVPEYEDSLTEYVGADATWGSVAPSREANEIYLRFGARDHDRAKLDPFSKMLPALILSGPPGVAVTGGRPRVQQVVAYWPMLVPRELCAAEVDVLGGDDNGTESLRFEGETGPSAFDELSPTPEASPVPLSGEMVRVPLREVAHGRSGDKGDTCNVGILARHEAIYPWLVETLTVERVADHFSEVVRGKVERFEVPNLRALNFLLHESLGGGGTLSLHLDAQGKTYSHALLSMEVDVDRVLLDLARGPGA